MRTIATKVARLIVVLLVVTFFSFSLLHMIKGDPARTAVPFANDQQIQTIRHEMGLDKPFFTQYRDWLSNFARGDMGFIFESVSSKRPIADQIKKELGVSLQLVFYAQFLALVIAIPVGVLAAYKAGTWLDKILNAGAFGLLAVPNFVFAFLLIFYLAVQAGWFPTQQYVAFGTDPAEHFRHMFLPAFSLAIGQIAIYMRLLRSDMIQTLQEDFITMAKAKGLTTRRILWRHALRPSGGVPRVAACEEWREPSFVNVSARPMPPKDWGMPMLQVLSLHTRKAFLYAKSFSLPDPIAVVNDLRQRAIGRQGDARLWPDRHLGC